MCPHTTIYVSRDGQLQVLDKRPLKKRGMSLSGGKEKGVEAGKGGGGQRRRKWGGCHALRGGTIRRSCGK